MRSLPMGGNLRLLVCRVCASIHAPVFVAMHLLMERVAAAEESKLATPGD